MAISMEDLVRTNAVMFVLASVFVLTIAWLHISKRKPCEPSEIVLYFGYIIYVVFWSCYMAAIPLISKMLLVATGKSLPYPGFFDDIKVQIALVAAGQVFYLTVLFLVKLSLLMLYRKLVVGLPGLLMYIWWGIVGLVVVSWIGSIFAGLFTCDDLKDFYSTGFCANVVKHNRQLRFSLYFSYSVDVITDLAVMLFPIRLTWNLRLPLSQKIAIMALFSSGLVCIAFATLRALQLGLEGRQKTTTIQPYGMLLWTAVESSMVIIVGCCPSFAVLIRKHINASKKSYGSEGYGAAPMALNPKRSNNSSVGPPKQGANAFYWADAQDSQEGLTRNSGAIVVKTEIHSKEGL